MTKRNIIIALVLLLLIGGGYHIYSYDRGKLTTAPDFTNLTRTIDGNDLISTYDPDAILRFDSSYTPLGGQKFILYGVADTEQYFYVETTPEDKLKSVFWIQYEAYLPDTSYTYDYDGSPHRVTIGDYEFFTDTDIVLDYDPHRKRRKGTDGALAREFLASKGYTYPTHWAYARYVYLTDESRQKELMIIYIDDISRFDVTAEQIKAEDSGADVRAQVEQAHMERIKEVLQVLPK